MTTQIDIAAPLAVLLLLATAFLVAFAAVLALWLRYSRLDRRRSVLLLRAAGVLAGGYAVALLAFSLASSERLLSRGQEKYFCEVDCHLAYSVVDAGEARLARAAGTNGSRPAWYRLILRTRFDSSTTAAWRPQALKLTPNPRRILLYDQHGRAYSPRWPAATGRDDDPLMRPLLPGQAYDTELAFELSDGAVPARLLITETIAPSYLLLGSENSPLHRKIFFALEPGTDSNTEAQRH